MARLGDYIEQIRGVSYKPEDVCTAQDKNSVAILRANNIQDDGLNFDDLIYVKKSKVSVTQYIKAGDIVVCASSGSKNLVGKAAIANKDMEISFGAFCKVVRPKKLMPSYVGYYFQSPKYRNKISELAGGANINNIRNEHIDELDIVVLNIDEQERISVELDKVCNLISFRKQQLSKLDELVKARFVELFGDAEHNEKGLPTSPMTELCEIIDGDRGKNYPKQEEFSEEGFCLFLNAKNVTSNGFSFENCMYITEEKDKILRNGKLSRGDVVLTTRGTLGNLAFYDESVPYEHMRINSGMVILRMKRDRITERFFIEQFKMQLASIKERIASGSAQPQLPISTMNKIVMLVPDVELQNQFAVFVEQTDKSKLAIQKSLEKLETLKKALMQQYFG